MAPRPLHFAVRRALPLRAGITGLSRSTFSGTLRGWQVSLIRPGEELFLRTSSLRERVFARLDECVAS
jgi:hypothetical protein